MPNLRKWSVTASGNASIAGGASTINWAEGQLPSTVNNSMREASAQVRSVYKPSEWGWIEHSATASVASQTTFKIAADVTADYVQGRRVRLTGGSTIMYGDIVSSSFTAQTTITLTKDSGSLSASMSIAAVSVGYSKNLPRSTKLTVDISQVGNVGAGEDNLITYSLPAGTLAIDGDAIRIKAWGRAAATGNPKTLKMYLGTAVIKTDSLPITTAINWVIEAIIVRRASNAQEGVAAIMGNVSTMTHVETHNLTLGQTDTAAITIKCTGTATDTDDIIQDGLLVELL